VKGSNSGFSKMISSGSRQGSKHRTLKQVTSPADLAKQFVELQRLREQVHELDRLAATDQEQAAPCARTDDERRNK
jgi:hypothetical protein